MRLRSLGLIGFGSIARELVAVLERELPAPLEALVLLVRPGTAARRRAELAAAAGERLCRRCAVHESTDALLEALGDGRTALAIECAGHAAVREHLPSTLRSGVESVVTSVGALGDDALRAVLERAADEGGTRLVVPSGAIGALDVVAALRRAGIERVRYRGRKSPRAWRGTPAESALDLDALTEPAVFFAGSARSAARDFPKNANVAAALALAGIGFDATEVALIADPGVTGNVHEFDVESLVGSVSVRVAGEVSPTNPKTSLPTVYSLAREVLDRVGPLAV